MESSKTVTTTLTTTKIRLETNALLGLMCAAPTREPETSRVATLKVALAGCSVG